MGKVKCESLRRKIVSESFLLSRRSAPRQTDASFSFAASRATLGALGGSVLPVFVSKIINKQGRVCVCGESALIAVVEWTWEFSEFGKSTAASPREAFACFPQRRYSTGANRFNIKETC